MYQSSTWSKKSCYHKTWDTYTEERRVWYALSMKNTCSLRREAFKDSFLDMFHLNKNCKQELNKCKIHISSKKRKDSSITQWNPPLSLNWFGLHLLQTRPHALNTDYTRILGSYCSQTHKGRYSISHWTKKSIQFSSKAKSVHVKKMV